MHHDIGVEREDGRAIIGRQHARVRAAGEPSCVDSRFAAAVNIGPGERQFPCVDDPAQGERLAGGVRKGMVFALAGDDSNDYLTVERLTP